MVTWSAPVALDSAGADFATPRSIVGAIDFAASDGGPAAVTVNGITFTSDPATGDNTIAVAPALGRTPAFDQTATTASRRPSPPTPWSGSPKIAPPPAVTP